MRKEENESKEEEKEIREPSLREYVELKTYKELDSGRAQHTWQRYKLLRFWIQSFLVGVPKIICGFRDSKGVLQSLKSYHTQALPSLASRKWVRRTFSLTEGSSRLSQFHVRNS